MQIHVINAANRRLYTTELDKFFRARHEIYVEEKGWRDADPSGMEIDQFDTDDATYLVGIVDGEVMTGTRLTPTTAPHMLSDVFPNMADYNGLIRRPDVAEWTRGFIIPKFREKGHGPIKGQFCGTVMEYCLNEGINSIGGVQDLYWLPLWKRFGWTVRPVGSPHEIDGRHCVAAFFDVTEHARDRALRNGGLDRSILVHRGPYQPFIPEPYRREDSHAA
jgi:acyl-homoserine lactone synthase